MKQLDLAGLACLAVQSNNREIEEELKASLRSLVECANALVDFQELDATELCFCGEKFQLGASAKRAGATDAIEAYFENVVVPVPCRHRENNGFETLVEDPHVVRVGFGPSHPAKPPTRQPQILVCDQDKDTLSKSISFFGSLGASVFTESCPQGALASYSDKTMDLVIVEVETAGVDDLEAIRALSMSHRQEKRVPVLTTSTIRDKDLNRRKTEAIGACLHIPKPFDWEKLSSLVSVLCRLDDSWVPRERKSAVS